MARPSPQDVVALVDQFVVSYDGHDADRHVIDARLYGESLEGASRLYVGITQYVVFGTVPKPRQRPEFICYAQPIRAGSIEQWLFVAPLLVNPLYVELYKATVTLGFGKVVSALKRVWTKPSDTKDTVETLADAIVEITRSNADAHSGLVKGLVRSNENMASLMSRLLDTIPALADATRKPAQQFITPIGRTCDTIIQLPGTIDETAITEADAEVISGPGDSEVSDMQKYAVTRISEVNVRTGHCIMSIDGVGGLIPGKITDPVLATPDNIYTKALNEHTPCIVDAKAVTKKGQIQRLYISNASRS